MKICMRILIWIPVIVVAFMITGFSAQTAGESSHLSRKVAAVIIDVVDAVMKPGSTLDREKRIDRIEYPVRKAAHMTEYAIFTVTVYVALTFNGMNSKNRWITALCIAFLLACSDEIHQRFVPGRSGRFKDVLIDTTGAAIALFFCGAMRRLWYYLKKRLHFTEK